MITKKNYFPIVCVVFTVAVFVKILIENVIYRQPDVHFVNNLVLIFAYTALIIALLGASKFFSALPLWLVIAGQYVILISAAMLESWISGHFQELAKTAYRDVFRSVTIAFIIVAFIYYMKCFYDVHRTNQNLEKLQKMLEQ